MATKKYKCHYCGRVTVNPSPHNCTYGVCESGLWFKEIIMEEKKEMVNHPSHYCQGNMECIDGLIGAFGTKEVATFCKINAMKYIWRLGHKDDEAQEIGKIKWYLDKYLELKEKPNPSEGKTSVKEIELKKRGLTDREIKNILKSEK
jgi:hypothetical protein